MFSFWNPDILFKINNIIVIGWLALLFAPFHKTTKYLTLAPALILSVIYSIILFQTLFLRGDDAPPLDFFHLNGWLALLKDPFMIVGTTNHFCVLDLWAGQWMVHDFYSGYTFAYNIILEGSGKYRAVNGWTGGRILFSIILLMSYMVAPLGFLVYHLLKFTILTQHKSTEEIDYMNGSIFKNDFPMKELQKEALIRRPVRFGDNFSAGIRKVYHFFLGVLGLGTMILIALPVYVGFVIYCYFDYLPFLVRLSSGIIFALPVYLALAVYGGFLLTISLSRRLAKAVDKLPWRLRSIYPFVLGIVGFLVLLLLRLPLPITLFMFLGLLYLASPKADDLYEQFKETGKKFITEYGRKEIEDMKFESLKTPHNQRWVFWQIRYLLLQLSTFIQYIPNSLNPIKLFTELDDRFKNIYANSYYVFGDGIAVNSYELVKRYLQDIAPGKTFESLGWKVSTSQGTFCDFTTIFLSSENEDMSLGRKIVFKWLHAFPYNLQKRDSEVSALLNRLVPRRTNEKPDEKTVYRAVGEVMFFLATGGELRKHERDAFVDCVKNAMIFFPDWFNFLLAGHALERKNLNSYYTLLEAFARYSDGQALLAAFEASENKKSNLEVLKLIAIVFSIAGSAAPAKLAVTVIDRLWSEDEKEKEKNVRLFKNNPLNFIKECARLDKAVPMVNVLARGPIIDEIEKAFKVKDPNIHIPEGTPIHCSIVNANRDRQIFDKPDDFNPERSDLNKLIVWNGVEEDIINSDKNKRPPRYCPGHDFSLSVIQFVAEQFLPLIPSENNKRNKDQTMKFDDSSFSANEYSLQQGSININEFNESDHYCYDALDNYTRIVMELMKIAIKDSNISPSRGSDIIPPLDSPVTNLNLFRIDMGRFIPSWDEDEPNGSNSARRFTRWLINQNILDFNDSLKEFTSVKQALDWRLKVFSDLPVPNIHFEDVTSDKTMTQLAFAGCACHYTTCIKDKSTIGLDIDDKQFLSEAQFVNDMTALSTFRVRKPFEKYGAAAFFNKNYEIIGIYWSHEARLVKKNDKDWEHAKYVWRSSFFAFITVRDHLIVAHMIESNALCSASRQYLPANHSLRLFLKPFTYHTVSINYQAAVSLVNERGLVHRIWAFDYDEFLKVCDYVSMNYKFRLLPEFISQTMTPAAQGLLDDEWDKIYPIHRDLNDFWVIIRKYVERFFQITYSVKSDDDDLPNDPHLTNFINELCKQLGIAGITSLKHLIDVLSQLIASNTGIHEHVGQVSDYMVDPRFIGAKLQTGKEMQNIQTYSQILVLTVLTGLRMPGILEDWSHLIEFDKFYSDNMENYKDFKDQLRQLSAAIDNRNRQRRYPFQSFNPKYLECSLSV